MDNIDDTNYWNTFYNKNAHLTSCSDFCRFVIDFFRDNNTIQNVMDCGCGNGRDSFMLSKFYKVYGVDNSGYIPKNGNNLSFKKDDFINIDKQSQDLIYSRFTFHSITNSSHIEFLKSISMNSYLAIEARSIIGMADTLIHGKEHYRNYISLEYLTNILKDNGFEILFIKEDKDMAIYKSENPVCIRAICKKIR